MTIGTNYATPVFVNGYLCRNCTDVEKAKKHIDPAHPKSGPFNINAKTDPTRVLQQNGSPNAANAVSPSLSVTSTNPAAVGGLVDITA